jgi:hypothetical protein
VNTHIAASDREQPRSQRENSWLLVGLAWGVTLLVSILPDIVLREVVHKPADWLLWGKIGATAFFVAGTFVWKPIRPLRGFFVVLLVLHLTGWVIGLAAGTDLWRSWFRGTAFSTTMLEVQIQKLLSALVMIAALLVIKGRPERFFLTAGALNAPAEPVRWLLVAAGADLGAVYQPGRTGISTAVRRAFGGGCRPGVTAPARHHRVGGHECVQ